MSSRPLTKKKMKRKLLRCERCQEETVHAVTHKFTVAGRRAGKLRREVKNCTQCGRITIKGRTKTYIRQISHDPPTKILIESGIN